MNDTIHRMFGAGEFHSLEALGALPHILSIPGPKPMSVRLLVKDVPSGRLGLLHVNIAGLASKNEAREDHHETAPRGQVTH